MTDDGDRLWLHNGEQMMENNHSGDDKKDMQSRLGHHSLVTHT